MSKPTPDVLALNDLFSTFDVNKYVRQLKIDPNGRNLSYEHCRSFFIANRTCKSKKENIALHLYCFLASWGMLRNSFLLNKDYKFLEPLVEILCSKDYNDLLSFEPTCKVQRELVFKLKNEISNYFLNKTYYKDTEDKQVITKVSDTLITKIMLGTFGCVPAYDTNYCLSLRKLHFDSSFSIAGFDELISSITTWDEIDHMVETINRSQKNTLYTKMKIVDVVLWEKGLELYKADESRKDKKITQQYYRDNAKKYFESTVHADVSLLYDHFLRYVPPKAKILDLGCGSGRDTKAFLDKGYSVDAVDGSAELCALASEHTGIQVKCIDYTQLLASEEYDAIWACASLLHLASGDLPSVFIKMRDALKNKGIAYISFKSGKHEGIRDGRYFTDMTPEKMFELLDKAKGFIVLEEWYSEDVRVDSKVNWYNVIIRKEQS